MGTLFHVSGKCKLLPVWYLGQSLGSQGIFYASTPCSVSLGSESTQPSPPGQDTGLEEGSVCSSHIAPTTYVSTYLPALPTYLPTSPTYLSTYQSLLTYLPVLPTYLSYLSVPPIYLPVLPTYLSVSYSN